jgi:hypothetical protein
LEIILFFVYLLQIYGLRSLIDDMMILTDYYSYFFLPVMTISSEITSYLSLSRSTLFKYFLMFVPLCDGAPFC